VLLTYGAGVSGGRMDITPPRNSPSDTSRLASASVVRLKAKQATSDSSGSSES
jgi:hypothetical protein